MLIGNRVSSFVTCTEELTAVCDLLYTQAGLEDNFYGVLNSVHILLLNLKFVPEYLWWIFHYCQLNVNVYGLPEIDFVIVFKSNM